MDFPKRLRQLRMEHELTQEQLGEKINVTKVSISGYENGNRSPDIDTLQKITDYFNVSVDYILGKSNYRSMEDIVSIISKNNDDEQTDRGLYKKDVGNRLRDLRLEKGMTQRDVAEYLGITRQGYGNYENGNAEPNSQTLKLLADRYGVMVDYILGKTDYRSMEDAVTDLTGKNISDGTREFLDALDLADEDFVEKIPLTVDGMPLSKEDAKNFVAFVRAKRTMDKS